MNYTLKSWVDQPNTRGTFDIIQSSFLTTFLCTWTCLHLNVPAAKEGAFKPILRKFRWMVFTILGPEFVVALALGQRADAKRVRDRLHELGYSQWTLRQSFYANMGGFVLHPRDSMPFPIHGLQLVYLVKEGYTTLPSMTSDEIADKSKADFLTKALVCLQTGWFVVQCFGRSQQGLPLTSLELTTIGYVWCTWAMYAQWLSKPLDIAVPTVLSIKASTAEILHKAGHEATETYRQTPLDFVFDCRHSWTLDMQPHLHFRLGPRERPLPRQLNDSLPWHLTTVDIVLVTFIIVFYGVILIFGWKFVFPTGTEKLLWRVAALVVVCSTAVFVAWELLWGIFLSIRCLYDNKKKITFGSIYDEFAGKREHVDHVDGLPVRKSACDTNKVTPTQVVLIAFLATAYVLSRLYIIAEALASLRAIPAGCFDTVDRAAFIPHF